METRPSSDILKPKEQLEPRPIISTDERIQEILFRLGRAKDSEATYTTPIAKKIWAHMRKQLQRVDEGKELPKEMALPADVSPEEWRALEIDIETEQIKYGERTPRVETMLASREQLQRSIRRSKEKYQTQWVMVKDEAMSPREKQESQLFALLEPVVKDLARELGILVPIELEITREKNLNAFIWSVAQEGGIESSNVPLRVFVSAGAIVELDKLIRQSFKKPLSLDHLSIIFGHELRHLQQAGYSMDSPPHDPEEAQRYEYDADAASFEATDRIGRNPRAGLELFQAMKNEQLSDLTSHYLAKTHPISENRVKELTMLFHRPDRPFFFCGCSHGRAPVRRP